MGPWKMSLDSKGVIFHFQDCWEKSISAGGTEGRNLSWPSNGGKAKKKKTCFSKRASRKKCNFYKSNQCLVCILHFVESLGKGKTYVYIYMSTSEVSLQFLKVFTTCNPHFLTREKSAPHPTPQKKNTKKKTTNQASKSHNQRDCSLSNNHNFEPHLSQ